MENAPENTQEDTQNAEPDVPVPVFRPAYNRYNRPGKIVTFGPYLATAPLLDATGAVRYVQTVRESSGANAYNPHSDKPVDEYVSPAPSVNAKQLQEEIRWTRLIKALNQGRKWPITRLAARLNREVSPGVAVVIVPSHNPYKTDPPIRALARVIASEQDRIDATACLVRDSKIRRITYGGQSTIALHRESIRVHHPELIANRSVLLMDDIALTGASLQACEALLYEAGAAHVQAIALARVAG